MEGSCMKAPTCVELVAVAHPVQTGFGKIIKSGEVEVAG
jgi:hypothetical protein